MAKLVCGFGVNDLDYPVAVKVDGKTIFCPYYSKWQQMLKRCSLKESHKDWKAYSDKSVDCGWIYASKFKSWMECQVWQGLELDKDILVKGNKIYSAENCAFVPQWLNKLIPSNLSSTGKLPLGVSYEVGHKMVNPLAKPYKSSISIYGNEKSSSVTLGRYKTAFEAHVVWQKAKVQALKDAIGRYRQEECYRPDIEIALLSRINKIDYEIQNSIQTLSV